MKSRKQAKPISPEEVNQSRKNVDIPNEVIEIFNKMIVKNWEHNRKSAKVSQAEVVDEIISTLKIERDAIFHRHYLDVEDIFRDVGWKVEYDKPAYNEFYGAFYTFSAKF